MNWVCARRCESSSPRQPRLRHRFQQDRIGLTRSVHRLVGEGEDLTFEAKDGALWVWDSKGNAAKITIKNVMQSNGVIHVIDAVLMHG